MAALLTHISQAAVVYPPAVDLKGFTGIGIDWEIQGLTLCAKAGSGKVNFRP
jgi:hypothetical protein